MFFTLYAGIVGLISNAFSIPIILGTFFMSLSFERANIFFIFEFEFNFDIA